MAKRYNGNLAKIHRNYSVWQVAELFKVHRNTVLTWVKLGLPCLKEKRPWLIVGSELRRFINDRRDKARKPCPPNHLHCLRCKAARMPAGMMLDYIPHNAKTGNLKGICSVCDAWMNRKVNVSKISVVAGNCEVTFPRGRQRIDV